MIPNPIRRVLFTTKAHGVRALLMGGQACVLYGAAQFSRDVDLVLLAEDSNLVRFREALAELRAEVVAVPPFGSDYLERGHAIHFRCNLPEVAGLRVDVMSRMRGVDAFELLWDRRTTLTDESGFDWELLALPDLVRAKKTQRDKDWPMIRALLEADYFSGSGVPSDAKVEFWFRELRTPGLLVELSRRFRGAATRVAAFRPAVAAAIVDDLSEVSRVLAEEERNERAADAAYWRPLKTELEQLRRTRPIGGRD